VAGGAGGGYVANGALRQQQASADPTLMPRFVGTHTGPIDDLAVEMYLFAPGRQTETTYAGSGDLLIDGELVATFDQLDLPLRSGGSAVLVTEVGFRDILRVMALRGLDLSPDAEHTVELRLGTFPLATTASVFVYDTTEAPSGMTFNTGGDLPSVRVRAS
jgi:hypothetical protein